MATDVSLGDVIRAWRALDARTNDERRAIARLLEFELREAESMPEPEPRPRLPQLSEDDEELDAQSESVPLPPPTPAGDPTPLDLVPFTDVQVNPVDLGGERLPPPTPAASTAVEPLFAPGWARSIACTLIARPSAVGAIDLERTTELFARREPIRRLPRYRRMISATEVTVVIDARGTLPWFRHDADRLVERIDAVTRATVDTVETDGAPVLAITTGPRGATRPRRPDDDDDGHEPIEPTRTQLGVGCDERVIALTDLGLGSPWLRGDPDRAQAWIQLAIALRARGSSLVVVTPVPRERIPPRLARAAACVYWDRVTCPGVVYRLIKERA